MGKNILNVMSLLLIMAGITLVFLPELHDYYYRMKTGVLISQSSENADSKELEAEWQRAVKYNKEMAEAVSSTDIEDKLYPEEYLNILNINGIMGYVTIPDIDMQLPIYHGTSNHVLEKGTGHLPSSSLPVGGKGNHCVITGHTGIEVGRMFNDLTKMETGDMFYLTVCGKELCYKVDNIAVVQPDDTELLFRSADKDYCTLVTCTPYGVNTHRLLVRGERVDNDAITASQSVLYPDNTVVVHYILSILAVIIIFIVLTIIFKIREGKRNEGKTNSN